MKLAKFLALTIVLILGPLPDAIAVGHTIVDDFESGLPSGTDGDGLPIGFYTAAGGGGINITTTGTPPAPVPGELSGNQVLAVDTNTNAGGFAVVIHAFENPAVDTWVTQDWSGSEGFSFWLYGNDTGSVMFIDILDNRNPGSTTEDAERFSFEIIVAFSGWHYFEIPFADFSRKEVFNGAPNDGFTLSEIHGWALCVFDTQQQFFNYLDDVGIYGEAVIPELEVVFSAGNWDVAEGETATVAVKLNREMNVDDPAQVSIDYWTDPGNATPGRDFTPAAGTLVFTNGGATEQTFNLDTFDNNKNDGTKRVIPRLTNPVDVISTVGAQATVTILDDEPFDANLLDDFESYPYLWSADGNVVLGNPEFALGDPEALPGQGAWEGVLEVLLPLQVEVDVQGRFCDKGNGVVPMVLLSTDTFDATTVDHTTVSLGDAFEAHTNKKTGVATRHEEDVDGDGDTDLVFHFRFEETGLPCDPDNIPFNGLTFGGQPITAEDQSFGRDFALGQEWSCNDSLTFWYYGQNSGDTITFNLLDNRAPDPGPAGWSLVWSDEFNDPAGTSPDPAKWEFEIGDGAVNGIPGWGNAELQYYTDSTANAATDGEGYLHISTLETDGSLGCYYGPCDYTSARLLSRNRAEFAYGRIESRILLPDGDAGLWPAFWSLGTDINQVGWPQTGEIDFMEYVSRLPNEMFGTIHGPGYSGGAAFGNVYDFGEPAYNDFHTFAIEWQPDLIKWYVDGYLYHTATPGDVAPNEWVFNDPVFMLLNQAVGGNFGGAVSEDLVFPQSFVIDYVRVFQGPDTAERWEAGFVDDFSGWQEVAVPFASFTRSAEQPAGAPDDGLGLNEVWGYGFTLPEGGSTASPVLLDQVRLNVPQLTVTSLDDSGVGSLRWALDSACDGGVLLFDPALAGGTIALSSGSLVTGKQVTIDAVDAAPVTVSGGGTDRVLIVDPGADVTVRHLAISDGYGWQVGGGILNNGALTLDHVTVSNNLMATDAGDFWQGGGGIYSGDGASLTLVDSTVTGNTADWSGGGVYSFVNSSTTILRSTISNNVSNDVGGGLRLLSNAEITNSTISGNQSTGWYGGAFFLTEGVVDLVNSTVADNVSPSWAPAAIFVGTFGSAGATLNLGNSIVANNATEGCVLLYGGAGAIAINSSGSNVFSDGTCSPIAGDQIVGDAGLGALFDNGGPTETHALLPGSPAIDAADNALCPATDQRSVARDATCDVGAFEF